MISSPSAILSCRLWTVDLAAGIPCFLMDCAVRNVQWALMIKMGDVSPLTVPMAFTYLKKVNAFPIVALIKFTRIKLASAKMVTT